MSFSHKGALQIFGTKQFAIVELTNKAVIDLLKLRN